ncbi:TolC family protein, partial [Myxococcota bacterium]|nr:TolC family protein [Myxococcota bacterium]
VDLLPLAPPAPGDDPGAAALDTDPLVAAPLLAAPLLTALRAERDAAARSLAAARRAALPDLAVEGGARWDGDPRGGTRATGFELGAGLELPLFDRQRAEIAAARARLAEAEALLARHQAERARRVAAAVEATRQLGPPTGSVDAEAVWAGARARYRQGEASIDDLLQAAADVAAAGAAQAEREALRRRAALDLSCATGAFPEPELQSLYEESAR